MVVVQDAPVRAGAAGLDLLASARRLDWRFLLQAPALGRVAYLGPADRALLDGLAAFAQEVDRLDRAVDDPVTGQYDLVVVRNPNRARLEAAAALVRPGGSVYAEFDRTVVRRLTPHTAPRRAAKHLERLGLEDVELHWHWPDFAHCTQIIPLAARETVAHSLGHRATRRSARARTVRDRALLTGGLLPSLARAVSVVARRPGDEPASRNAIHAAIEHLVAPHDLERRGLDAGLAALLVTPRFRTSRHVVALLFPPGESTPALVAKIPRLAGDGEAVAHEAAILTVMEGARADGDATIARLVGFGEAFDRPILVQTPLVGRPLTPGRLRLDFERSVSTVLGWLADVAARTGTLDGFPAWHTLIVDPVESFARSFPARDDDTTLVRRTLELTRPLADAELPLGVQHGDLSHPNLIALDGGGIGVIDWELAELHGLPLQDACFFLAYATFARTQARGVTAELAAFHEAFVAPGGWAARELGAFARLTGVPDELVTPLFVACWARYTARTLLRLEPTSDTMVAGDGRNGDWIRRSRYYALWRHAVEHVSELRWGAE